MIKTVVTDVDGVLTTGRFFYGAEGKLLKEFGPHDADGVRLLREAGIAVVAVSADRRGGDITSRRLDDMNVELLFIPEHARLDELKSRFDKDTTLFIGDGYHDAPALRWFDSCAPADACKTARDAAKRVLATPGGGGVLLEVALALIKGPVCDPVRPIHGNILIRPVGGPETAGNRPPAGGLALSAEAQSRLDVIMGELRGMSVDRGYQALVGLLAGRGWHQVVGFGAGRMGLALRAFIMRLAHLGLRAYMWGDPGVTACGEDTLVIINSSSGATPTVVLLAKQAKAAGATLVLVTCTPISPLGYIAGLAVIYAEAKTQQPMKTLHEQFTFLLFDALAADVAEARGVSHADMSRQHSTLE